MYRFQTSPQKTSEKKLWVSLLLFLFLILLFTFGTSSLDYRTQGSNIYPEVTIIERGR